MRISLSIPDELFQSAERRAKLLGISRSELYRRAIERYLRASDDEAITEALNAFCEKYPELNRLDPVMEEMQLRSLPKEDWQ